MTWLDRGGRDGGGAASGARVGGLATVALAVLFTLSGVLTPVGPVDASLPVVGSQDAAADGGGAADPAAAITNGTDSDDDGLPDDIEREIGTDPTDPDTDGDGYSDGMEVGCGERLPGADPLQQDVYVEVDAVANVSLTDATVERVEDTFASAPVENPHGADGIDLHLVRSDEGLPAGGPVNNRESPGNHSDIGDYRDAFFDNERLGYHYMLVVSEAAYRGDPSYAGAGYRGNVVLEHYDRETVMASLIMHELGHSFGLMRHQDGVDDEGYDLGEYQSVMNYNGIYETLSYSDGTDELGRDEWAFVESDRHVPALDCPDGDCTALCGNPA